MGNNSKPISNFSAGEISPRLKGRVDTTVYQGGADVVENCIIGHYGDVKNTSGTRYVARAKFQDKKCRLIPFVFSSGDSYILEFGDLYIRFFSDSGSVVKTAINISGITKANPAVVTLSGTAPANGAFVDIESVVGMTEVNGKRFKVANRTSTTFQLQDEDGNNVNSTNYTTYTSGGTIEEVYEIVSPYSEANLDDIRFTQQADLVYLAHPSLEPRKLSRFGSTNWTIATKTYDALDFPPFLDENATATTIASSGTTGTVTLTASTSLFVSGSSGHIGAYFNLTGGYVKVTAVSSGTSATATVIKTLTNGTATADWSEGAWSAYQGYPSDVKFFEERLYYAGTTRKPLTIWGSVIGSYENFETGTEDDMSVSFTASSAQVDKINFLYPTSVLNIGTAGGPFVASSGSSTAPISYTSISVKQQNELGSANITPIRVGPYVYYITRSSTVLARLAYDLDTDSYKSDNMTYLSDHILEGGVKQMALQLFPYAIVWIVRNDGVMVTMTREDDQNVKGWARQIAGGTAGKYESVAVIPNGLEDQVWVSTSRTIDGGTKRHIEYFEKHNFGVKEDAFFVHSGLTYSGSPVTTVTNLDHLEGETVSILTDGAVHPSKVVTNGSVSLNWSASKVQVGLPYTSTLKTVSIEPSGLEQGKPMHIGRVNIRFYKSLGCSYGDGTTTYTIPFRDSSMPMNQSPSLYTGDKEVIFPAGWRKERYIEVKQPQPLPFHILGLFPRTSTAD